MDDPALSPKQQEVYQQIYELLAEHFDGAIVVITVEDVGPAGNAIATRFAWVGGAAGALGMAEMLKHKLLKLALD